MLSIVSAVAYPELPDQQGVSVCVPGAYVTGIDTKGDGTSDLTASAAGTDTVFRIPGHRLRVRSYQHQWSDLHCLHCPVILNTGAAGYGSQNNTLTANTYADGYINVSFGNCGKQDPSSDENGDTYYTGDTPSCLAGQKAAARYVQYNILLGNLPGSSNYLISTGDSGGGAHAVMFAATSNNPNFYDYQIEAGAVGGYYTEDGGYSGQENYVFGTSEQDARHWATTSSRICGPDTSGPSTRSFVGPPASNTENRFRVHHCGRARYIVQHPLR